ncbi:MAG: 30S ribosomal protein S20 [Mariprofundaceae bacterium]|nr:30S ribosomal protein S20 [Mariprofundaceae bacterium]
MANHASALKRARQDEKKRGDHRGQRSEMRTAIKKVQMAVADGDKDNANALLKSAISKLDKAGRKGLIHSKQASRSASRLNTSIKNMA